MPLQKIHQQRIGLVAGTILTVVSLLVGVTVFIVMQRHAEALLSTSLQSSLQNRVQLTRAEIGAGFDRTMVVANRPLLIDQIQRANAGTYDAAAQSDINRVARSFLHTGLSAVAVFDKNGRELAHAGVFAQKVKLAVPLNLPGQVQLMWNGQLVLHAVVDMQEAGRVVGKVITEVSLPTTTGAFKDASRLGKTVGLALCVPFGLKMQCFPTTLNPLVMTLSQRSPNGDLLPMAHALTGETGFVTTHDYRHQEVGAAYAPVGDLGLGMVLKMDSAELYAPVWNQLRYLIPLLLGVLIIALLLLRWLLTPLVVNLIRSNAELEHIAHYDGLTGLPNRALLADRIQQAIAQSKRRKQSMAIVYIDLDGFKAVNDKHGHDVGDELLRTVAQRLKIAMRASDTLARIGGDEFVAVLVDLEQPQDCETVLARLLQTAADLVTVGDAVLQVSASIGVTLYPQDEAEADHLMRHADQAMYIAKQTGKNRYHLFDVALDTAVKP